jgi:Bacterial inner membrane protein
MNVLIGYLASAFLACSLLVNSTLKFRWLSTAGQICFITYGIIIGAWPVIIANTVLLCINIYQLYKLYQYKEQFTLTVINETNNIVQQFIQFYKSDIESYFPNFNFTSSHQKICFVILRDLSIANLFVAKLTTNGDALVEINYTVSKYRDFKVGKFIFEAEKEFLLANGVTRIVYDNVFNKQHATFLKVMGFTQVQIDNKSCMAKIIA